MSVAAERPRARPAARADSVLAIRLAPAALLALVLLGALVALAAPATPSLLPTLPGGAPLPRWVLGPLSGTGLRIAPGVFGAALGLMLAAYLVVIRAGAAVPTRLALGALVLLHLLFTLAPPLLSNDAFAYLDYGRLAAVHHLNPYTVGPAAAPGDPAFAFTGPVWHGTPSVYGPLFTGLSAALGLLPLSAALWVLKGLTGLAGLGAAALAWACARRIGRPPLAAALFLGLNPLVLVYGVGGAHNDVLLALSVLAAAWLVVAGREAGSGAGIVAGAAVKAVAALVAPFVVLGSRRRIRALAGAVFASVVVGGVALAVFGTASFDVLSTLGDTARRHVGEYRSVPGFVAAYAGFGLLGAAARALLLAAFAAAALVAAVRVWRRPAIWISAAAVAVLALLLTSTTLQPWYVLWVLPLAALAEDRRVRLATLGLCVLVVLIGAVRALAPLGLHYPHAG